MTDDKKAGFTHKTKLDDIIDSVDEAVPVDTTVYDKKEKFVHKPPWRECPRCKSKSLRVRTTEMYNIITCLECGAERKVLAQPSSRLLKRKAYGPPPRHLKTQKPKFRDPTKNHRSSE